jgi:phosphoribosylamine--glycine ligase
VHVLHAGTEFSDDGALISAGGRVLSVVGYGPSLTAARERAYRGVDYIKLDGSQHRKDIAKAVAEAEKA